MVHVGVEHLSIFCHTASLAKLHQFVHLEFKLIHPEFLCDRRVERLPCQPLIDLTKCVYLVRALASMYKVTVGTQLCAGTL